MVIELNGLSFHLRVSGDVNLRAHIVDEAFMYEQMSAPVSSVACVMKLIEDYSGLKPGDDIAVKIAHLCQPKAKAA